ncbi:MAG: FkbM family methyltransferase [Acidobacteria bacterium]|nr:FkbM family methyltransferase [Acidobacteriota bacterium]
MTYNHQRFIAQAIDSALTQRTDFAYEIVIGDDFSTDATREIAIEYQQKYPERIRLVLPPQNLGFDGNLIFIETLRAGRGEFVALLDGDDYWSSADKLQRQVDFLEAHPECSLCFHDALMVFDDGKEPSQHTNGNGQKEISTLDDLWVGCFVETCTAVFRRTALPEIPDWLQTIPAQDWANYILIAHHGKLGYINEVMGVYRKHAGGVWSKLDRDAQEEQVISFYEQIDRHLGFRYQAVIQEMKTRRLFELSREYEQSGDLERAARYLERCLAEHPAWLEQYLPGVGEKGAGVWPILRRRLRSYRYPLLYRRRQRDRASATNGGPKPGEKSGSITAYPNPLPLDPFAEVSAVSLCWKSTGTKLVEVRVGAPDGPLLSRSGPEGRMVTGQWVQERMSFYLQDVSDDLPLTADHTLARVTIEAQRGGDAEMLRLRALPPYYHTVTELLGKPFEILDPPSFLNMYRHFFVRQMHRFGSDNPQPFIIDGGANIGLSTLYYKHLHPASEVLAFEPDSQAFALLERNVRHSGQGGIEMIRAALAAEEKEVGFKLEGAYGSRIARGDDPADEVVRTVRLRDYLRRRVDLLKLSIEGAETEVIADCADLLDQVERMVVRYHSVAGRPQTLPGLLGLLADAGFRIHIKQFTSSAQPLERLELPNGEDLHLYIFALRQPQGAIITGLESGE